MSWGHDKLGVKEKCFQRLLSLQFPSMQCGHWLNADWGWCFRGNSAFASSEKRGSPCGCQLFLTMSCVRTQARHSSEGSNNEHCGRIFLCGSATINMLHDQGVTGGAAPLILFMRLLLLSSCFLYLGFQGQVSISPLLSCIACALMWNALLGAKV